MLLLTYLHLKQLNVLFLQLTEFSEWGWSNDPPDTYWVISWRTDSPEKSPCTQSPMVGLSALWHHPHANWFRHDWHSVQWKQGRAADVRPATPSYQWRQPPNGYRGTYSTKAKHSCVVAHHAHSLPSRTHEDPLKRLHQHHRTTAS